MNSYTLDELYVGMTETYNVSVTEEMVGQFLAITGDINPLHNDIEYATKKGYKNKVVYGMLTASLLSTLAGVYLPGERCLIHSVEIKMMKPVYVGDILCVYGEISEKSESLPVITLKVTIKNQNSEMVMRGKMQLGVN